ncbi:MAG TPA: four helix bundle suffix domain-containing protein [Pontiellaceae bacterium]|nr:four helix bundle suffix domain-containing protein [Pontiellaceae bacterium]
MNGNTNKNRQVPAGNEGLIPKHGGFRNLKSFQLAQLIYDITVRFCDKFVSPRSRTHDQMVQAARSGTQNIAEGSVDSATSKKIELKLTGIAKGSLEELRLDYQDYLRQRSLPEWPPDHPALVRFKKLRCSTLQEFRAWVAEEAKKEKKSKTDKQGQARTDTSGVKVGGSPCSPVFPSVCVANGALSLLNLCIYLLDRQLCAQAETFEKEGGFTERLYRIRSERRRNS